MLNINYTTCNICGKNTEEKQLAHKLIKDLPENQRFGGKLRIVECQVCGLRYLNPAPAPEDLAQIYDFDIYQDSTNSNTILQDYFDKIARQYRSPIKDVLEIGCGTGDFLSLLENKGINVSGVEFAATSQKVKFKGKLYVGRMEDIDIDPDQFDVIFLLNVIEHLLDPSAVLEKIKDLLHQDGILIMRHPNSDLFFNVVYKHLIEFPKYLLHQIQKHIGKKTGFGIVGFQNQHLYYFNYISIKKLLEKSNFKIEYFTTVDPYNRYRINKELKKLRVVRAVIALIRDGMGYFRLGPECIIVARSGLRQSSP